MRVCIDAGHGGTDPGASANGITESDWAMEFAQRVGHHVRKGGHETVLTRASNRAVAIATRAAIAVERKCDLFISIHCNAAGSSTATGAEVFVAPTGAYAANSRAVGETVLRACQEQGLDSRGVKLDSQSQHKSLGVLRGTCERMPAVLLEVGFLSSAFDSKLLKNKYWRESLTEKIAAALVR